VGIDAGAVVEHGSILRGEHEREDARRLRRVSWIVGAELELGIVAIDFPKELIARQVEIAEVMLPARFVVGCELGKDHDVQDDRHLHFEWQGVDAGRRGLGTYAGKQDIVQPVLCERVETFMIERHLKLKKVEVKKLVDD
jgi:hypothetical protein